LLTVFSSRFWVIVLPFLIQYALLALFQAIWLYDPKFSGGDFLLTYLAAQRGLNGDSPYYPYQGYPRPPFSLSYIAPLTVISEDAALFVLRVVDAAAYLAALPATLYLVVREGVTAAISPRLGLLLTALWVTTATFHHNLYSGQVNGITILAMVAAFLCWRHDRRFWAGLLLAAAVLTKAYPVLMAVLWLRARDFRVLSWLAAGIAIGIVIPIMLFGPQASLDYLRIAPYIAAFAASSFDMNLSPGSVAALVVRDLHLPGDLAVAVVGRGLSLAVFLAGALQISRTARKPFIALEFAFMLTLLMIGGQLIEYDHIQFVMPGVVIIFLILAERKMPLRWFVVLGVALELIQVNTLTEYLISFPSAALGYILLCGLCWKLLGRYRREVPAT